MYLSIFIHLSIFLNFQAIDGLSWVASERTVLEKLLDLEIVTREGGNTSTLLYETDNLMPSCFAITW